MVCGGASVLRSLAETTATRVVLTGAIAEWRLSHRSLATLGRAGHKRSRPHAKLAARY